jgi:hypothetical protein
MQPPGNRDADSKNGIDALSKIAEAGSAPLWRAGAAGHVLPLLDTFAPEPAS